MKRINCIGYLALNDARRRSRKGICKFVEEVVVVYFELLSRICLEGLRNITKDISQLTRCAGTSRLQVRRKTV